MNINSDAQRILFYGDSLVFGKIPGGIRYDSATRFTGIVQRELGIEYEIIEEGLRGRTAAGENTFFPHRNGLEQFGAILGSHLPIDLLILFLGTNDINSGAHKTSEELAANIGEYKKLTEWWCNHLGLSIPEVLLMAPPRIEEKYSYELFKDIFRGSEEKSLMFSDLYKNIALKYGWHFFDSSIVVKPSRIDGIHLDKENNEILGKTLAIYIQSFMPITKK